MWLLFLFAASPVPDLATRSSASTGSAMRTNRHWRFDLPKGGRNFRLKGSFQITSGGSRDIKAYVVEGDRVRQLPKWEQLLRFPAPVDYPMSSRTAAVLIVLILAIAAVVCVHQWTNSLRYEIVGGERAAHILDRKTGEVTWITGGKVRSRVY